MQKSKLVILSILSVISILTLPSFTFALQEKAASIDTAKTVIAQPTPIKLPAPALKSNFSLEQALAERRSTRTFSDTALTIPEISQLLWAAQGITDPKTGHRTAPSAMATYPLELYVTAVNVKDLPAGLYHYLPKEHAIVLVKSGDVRAELSVQPVVKSAPAVFLFSAVYERTNRRGGTMGAMFVHYEVGHAAENLCLQATALHLGIVTVGGFDPMQVKKSIPLPEKEEAMYVLPVGKP
ncbi:MAG: SagB/ThcOx family dehydrogenase [bacterium]